MSDLEIVKGLKELLEVMLCEGDLQRSATISKSIDLINRLQAEVNHLDNESDALLADIDFRDKENKKLQAENERLKDISDNKTKELLRYNASIEELHKKIKTAKAEAYKVFAERLKMRAINRYNEFEDYQEYPYATITHIDELLKDLVGE